MIHQIKPKCFLFSPFLKSFLKPNFKNIYQIKQIKKMQKQPQPNSQKQSIEVSKEQKFEDHEAGEKVFNRVRLYLQEKNAKFEVMEHESTKTSKESAIIRNTPLEWGSKTMLVQSKDKQIYMLLYRANNKINWSKLRKVECLGKKARMCEEAQLQALGVKPGAVPPFAHLLGLKGIIDSKFKLEKTMAFNAGLRSRSIVMQTMDFPLEYFQEFDITD